MGPIFVPEEGFISENCADPYEMPSYTCVKKRNHVFQFFKTQAH